MCRARLPDGFAFFSMDGLLSEEHVCLPGVIKEPQNNEGVCRLGLKETGIGVDSCKCRRIYGWRIVDAEPPYLL